MAFCKNCGHVLEGDAQFCPACGRPVEGAPGAAPGKTAGGSASENVKAQFDNVVEQFRNMEDDTAQFDPEDVRSNRVMAILAYLGILVLVPLFAAPGSRFARFHTNQGLVLFLAAVVWGLFSGLVKRIFSAVWWPISTAVGWALNILTLVFVVYIILGIIHAARGEAKRLPFIGGINLLK